MNCKNWSKIGARLLNLTIQNSIKGDEEKAETSKMTTKTFHSIFLRWVCVHWAERNLLMCIPGAEGKYESKNTTLPLFNSQVYLKHGIYHALNHSKCCILGAKISFLGHNES